MKKRKIKKNKKLVLKIKALWEKAKSNKLALFNTSLVLACIANLVYLNVALKNAFAALVALNILELEILLQLVKKSAGLDF